MIGGKRERYPEILL